MPEKNRENTLLLLFALLRQDVSVNWQLETLANQLGRSTRSLQRDIAKLDHSYSSLVRAIRIEHAAHLLASTAQSLGDIAAQCGFCDQPHFQRDFKKIVAMTPRQYRLLADKNLRR